MSNTNYQPVPSQGGEGQQAPPPAYAPQARQPVSATSGGLPQQYAQPFQPQQNNPPSYAYPAQTQQPQYVVPQQAQQPIIVQPQQQQPHVGYQTTTVIVAKTGQSGAGGYGSGGAYGQTGTVEPMQDLTCLSILACICCAWPCGIFAIVYSCNAVSAHQRGNYDEYRRANGNAKTCIGISCVIGVLGIIILSLTY